MYYLNSQIPSPIFLSDDLIHMGAGGKIELTFMVNSNWIQNIIGIAGSTNTSMTGNPARNNFQVIPFPATGVPPAATSDNTMSLYPILYYICTRFHYKRNQDQYQDLFV